MLIHAIVLYQIVKCHDTRSLDKNRTIARERLIDKLDYYYNKDQSVEAQVTRILKERELIKKELAKKKREEKALRKAAAKDSIDEDVPSDEDVNSVSEENEHRNISSSVKSNDAENGVEKPT